MAGYSINRAATILEWDRLMGQLATRAGSELGREACRRLPFLEEPERIERALAEVSEARSLLDRDVHISFGDLFEPGPVAKRARVGSALDGADLLAVAGLLRLSRKAQQLLQDEADRLPLLAQRANLLCNAPDVERDIFARLERDGRVSDNASPELRQLRDRYRVVHDQIHATLDQMIAGSGYEDALQEKLFTLRNGRFVLPVKVDHKGAVDGIVHDISQTGQSVYIEPRQVTGLNNRLRTAEIEIERELHRILLELTYKVAGVIDEIEAAVEAMTALDVIFAKAHLATDLRANPVQVTRRGAVVLPAARHPLLSLQMDNVIPNDVNMDQAHTLVLSGPNTGGKTVLLKTVGLAALMLRAGMHLPCGPDGVMPVFRRLFAVIGDEQSIEHNLSSFSSHLLNLKHIVEEVVPNSLVLIDEIGEGTDPGQGVALAKAILDELHQAKARTLLSTHFADLMAYAQIHEGWVNAAMAFDEATMTPTFRLLTGTPGRSSAFEIAARLGLSDAIVKAARAYASGTDTKLDAVIGRLEEERQKLNVATGRAEEDRAEAERLKLKQQEVYDELRSQKSKLAAAERDALKKELAEAKKAVKQVIHELQAAPSFAAAEAAKTKLRRLEQDATERLPEPTAEAVPEHLEPVVHWGAVGEGGQVYARPLKEMGTVLELPDSRGRVRLQVRDKKMTLPADQCYLRRGQEKETKPKTRGAVQVVAAEDDENLTRLDLRGQAGDDALIETERFLDQAARLNLPEVILVHGHGTGVLKRVVRDYLRRCPYARGFRAGKRGEGGDGATVVQIDG
jgi:DNA mismatch repair protein MutS2